MFKVKAVCFWLHHEACGLRHGVEVEEDEWAAWKFNHDKRLIQDVWPQLSPLGREIILAHNSGAGGFCDCDMVFMAREVQYTGGLQVQFDNNGDRLHQHPLTDGVFETAMRTPHKRTARPSTNCNT